MSLKPGCSETLYQKTTTGLCIIFEITPVFLDFRQQSYEHETALGPYEGTACLISLHSHLLSKLA